MSKWNIRQACGCGERISESPPLGSLFPNNRQRLLCINFAQLLRTICVAAASSHRGGVVYFAWLCVFGRKERVVAKTRTTSSCPKCVGVGNRVRPIIKARNVLFAGRRGVTGWWGFLTALHNYGVVISWDHFSVPSAHWSEPPILHRFRRLHCHECHRMICVCLHLQLPVTTEMSRGFPGSFDKP